ncbi:MAG: ribosomal protein L7/L12 [Planctomycetota bacterium]|jgi:ribosomal protein L7/L12
MKPIYTVYLTGYMPKKKIPVIKEVRFIRDKGLKEAKDIVDGLPNEQYILRCYSLRDADMIRRLLERAGGIGKIKLEDQ